MFFLVPSKEKLDIFISASCSYAASSLPVSENTAALTLKYIFRLNNKWKEEKR